MAEIVKAVFKRFERYLPVDLIGWLIALTLSLCLVIAACASWIVLIKQDAISFSDGLIGVRRTDRASGIPIGTVIAYFGGGSVPHGFEICDGELVTTESSPIRSLRKPDLRGRYPKGATQLVAGAGELLLGGSNEVILKESNLPSHRHELPNSLIVSDKIERSSNYRRDYIGAYREYHGYHQTREENRVPIPIRVDLPHQEVLFLIKVL